MNLAGGAIEFSADIEFVTVFRMTGLLDGLFDRFDHLAPVNPFLPRHSVSEQKEPRRRED